VNRINDKRDNSSQKKGDNDVQRFLPLKQIDDLEVIDPGKGNKKADKYYEK
jgi:hypothetical protein